MSIFNRIIFLCLLFVFSTQAAMTAQNHKNRGSKEEAKVLLDRAVGLVNINEVVAFTMMTVPNTGFQNKDLYPFCIDKNGILLAHPYDLGASIKDMVSEDGVKVGMEMLDNAKNSVISEISYLFPVYKDGILTNKKGTKTTLYTRVKNYVCASGFYSD
jgi:hypothetical protein